MPRNRRQLAERLPSVLLQGSGWTLVARLEPTLPDVAIDELVDRHVCEAWPDVICLSVDPASPALCVWRKRVTAALPPAATPFPSAEDVHTMRRVLQAVACQREDRLCDRLAHLSSAAKTVLLAAIEANRCLFEAVDAALQQFLSDRERDAPSSR